MFGFGKEKAPKAPEGPTDEEKERILKMLKHQEETGRTGRANFDTDEKLSEANKLEDVLQNPEFPSTDEYGAPTQERQPAPKENNFEMKPVNEKGPWDNLEGSGEERAAKAAERDKAA